MAIKIYTKEYAGMLPDIYEVKSHFLRTFGGRLQVVDGIKDTDVFMELKVSDAEVIVQDYSTDPNVAFGTGTGNSNRFGPRNEIKSVNEQVEYDAPLAIHEGIDDFTVNDIPDQVVAERLAKHAEAWTEHLNGVFSSTISASASETLTGELTAEGLTAVFNRARSIFTNNKISKTIGRTAYVTSDVYNLLVDSGLTTAAKQSSANVDTGEIRMFKGFVLEELADEYFQADENVYFAADGVGVAGIGINVARAMDSEDFAGVALQGAGKYAKYIPEQNQAAILKAELTDTPAG